MAAHGTRQTPPAIYNLVPHPNNLLSSEDFSKYTGSRLMKTSLQKTLWYPFMITISNPWLYKFGIIFYHLLPAYVIDLLLRLQGKKPRLVELYKKVHKNVDVLSFFILTHFIIDVANTDRLWKSLSDIDQQIFPFDIEFFDWDSYFDRTLLGMRVYLAKDDNSEEALERARKRVRRYVIDVYKFN